MRVGRFRRMMHPMYPRLRASLIAMGLPLLLVFATSAAATTATYTGSVSATGVEWRFKTPSVAGSGPLTESLMWSTSDRAAVARPLAQERRRQLDVGCGKPRRTAADADLAGHRRHLAVGGRGAFGGIQLHPDRDLSHHILTARLGGSRCAGIDHWPTVSPARSPRPPWPGRPESPVVGRRPSTSQAAIAGQVIGPVSDNGDGSYSATITASTRAGIATITATDESASPTLSGSRHADPGLDACRRR